MGITGDEGVLAVFNVVKGQPPFLSEHFENR
jgi:hypothetical protein